MDGESREGMRPVRERPLGEKKHRSKRTGCVRCNVAMSGLDDDGGGKKMCDDLERAVANNTSGQET